MKKFLVALILGATIMTVVHAKTVVCYFSCTGNTKTLAQNTSKALDADLFEIVPEVPYTDADLNWNDSKSRSTTEKRK